MDNLKTPTSSQIEEASYNRENKTMDVKFKTGAIYQYKDVPSEVWEAYCDSESVGKFLNSQIKGKYEYTKLP